MATTSFRSFNTVGYLGWEVKRLRKAAGLSQAELAERAGVSRKWVVLCEQGHVRGEIGKLMMVVRALGLELRFDRPPQVVD